jgi:hypothetical protein
MAAIIRDALKSVVYFNPGVSKTKYSPGPNAASAKSFAWSLLEILGKPASRPHARNTREAGEKRRKTRVNRGRV